MFIVILLIIVKSVTTNYIYGHLSIVQFITRKMTLPVATMDSYITQNKKMHMRI